MMHLRVRRQCFTLLAGIVILSSFYIVSVAFYKIWQENPPKTTTHDYVSHRHGNENVEIHVITNYPLMFESPWKDNQTTSDIHKLRQRQIEIEETLQRNLDHPLVTNIHLIVTQESAEKRLMALPLHNKHKMLVQRITTMPKYRDFFQYASEKLLNRIVVFMNMDIYLDEGFELINKTFLVQKKVSYALTRSGRVELKCNLTGIRGYCGNKYGGSHDAYIFVLTKPLTHSVLSELDYSMNVMGGENVLIWIFKNRMGMKVLNPCKILRAYHNHCVRIHGNFRPRIYKTLTFYRGKSVGAPETGLYTRNRIIKTKVP